MIQHVGHRVHHDMQHLAASLGPVAHVAVWVQVRLWADGTLTLLVGYAVSPRCRTAHPTPQPCGLTRCTQHKQMRTV